MSAVPVLFAVQKSAQKICNAARGEGGEVKIRVEKGGSDPYPLPPGKPREKIQEPREPLETQSRTNARTDSQSTNIGESKNHENHENHHPRASRRTIQNPTTLKNRRTTSTTRTTRITEHATHLKIEEPGGPRTHHRADTQLQMPKHRTIEPGVARSHNSEPIELNFGNIWKTE